MDALNLRVFALLALASACNDGNSNCGNWAEGGECAKNAEFMRTACAESCGFCTPRA